MYILCVNHQGGSYQVSECIYHVSVIKKEVIKLRCVYVIRQSSRRKLSSCGVHISFVNHRRGSYKVAVCIHVYHTSIIKEEVIKLRYLSCINRQGRSHIVAVCIYHASSIKEELKKLRCEYIIGQSSRRKLKSCGVYISFVNHQGRS